MEFPCIMAFCHDFFAFPGFHQAAKKCNSRFRIPVWQCPVSPAGVARPATFSRQDARGEW
jgi:hypothetical protein